MWLGHRFQGQRSRSPGRFTQCGLSAWGRCSGDRDNVLGVGNYCYVASALRRARRWGATGSRGAGAYRVATRTACLMRCCSMRWVPPITVTPSTWVVWCFAFVYCIEVAVSLECSDCRDTTLLHCTLSLAAQCIVIGPVWRAGGRAGGVCEWVCYHDNTRNCMHRSSPNWACR